MSTMWFCPEDTTFISTSTDALNHTPHATLITLLEPGVPYATPLLVYSLYGQRVALVIGTEIIFNDNRYGNPSARIESMLVTQAGEIFIYARGVMSGRLYSTNLRAITDYMGATRRDSTRNNIRSPFNPATGRGTSRCPLCGVDSNYTLHNQALHTEEKEGKFL